MKRTKLLIAWLVLLALFLAACAGENGAGGKTPATSAVATSIVGTEPAAGAGVSGDENSGETADISRLSGLIELQVNDLTGSVAGTIDSLVVSPGSGQILYALLIPAFEGAQHDSQVPVPWELLQANTQSGRDQGALAFYREAEALREAPTLAADGQVDFSDPAWDDKVVNHWTAAGVVLPDVGENDRSGGMVQMRELDRQVADQDGAALGSAPDLLLDSVNGFMIYLLVDTGEKLVPVPYNLVEVDPGSGNFTVRAAPERVQAAPGFASLDQLPDLAQQTGWETEIRAYWVSQQ